ncbi:MAG: GGDEF domain-containing protein [Geobacteraceae bacterium]|nr:GGDEF domain-containing protein [Geobacteraceae bacterium]NTW79779.1 GGDEF domain-containing protein [Geobacteraceae bacterium]
MMTDTIYNKIQGEMKAALDGADRMGAASISHEDIHAELEEARFISSFMAAVCSSLEVDDICSIAARALYEHFPYYKIVFAFSADFEGKVVTFSPMIQKGTLAAKPKVSVGKPCSLSTSHEGSLASAHLSLLDNMGSISIYVKSGQDKTLSESFLISVAAYFSQAIKNAQEHGRMKDLAMRDGLTELFNRRIFDETLAQKVKNQDMRPVSLLIIDLDNFKQVNDTFGHPAGDQVLKTVARILKESCRGQDLVARFGGEEFAIILSQTKAATAHAIAQRIRNRLSKTVFTFDDRPLHMTASIGLATCQEGNTIFTSNLVKQADRALYQAKSSGKNRVCVFPADLLEESIPSLGEENFGSFVPASC